MCFVVRATGDVFLMGTTWTDGVPAEVPTDHLSGLMWNPALIARDIERIDGLAGARIIGVDGMSQGIATLLARTSRRDRSLVDGDEVMRTVRTVKLPAEVDCLVGIAIAEGAERCARCRRAGRPRGRPQGAVRGIDRSNGTTLPGFEPFLCAVPADDRDVRDASASEGRGRQAPRGRRPRRRCRRRCSRGYEGLGAQRIGRAAVRASDHLPAQARLHRRWRAASDAMTACCTPGTSPAAAAQAWCLPMVSAPPVARHGVGSAWSRHWWAVARARRARAAGQLDARRAGVRVGRGVGGYLGADTVRSPTDGPVTLSRMPDGPLADVDAGLSTSASPAPAPVSDEPRQHAGPRSSGSPRTSRAQGLRLHVDLRHRAGVRHVAREPLLALPIEGEILQLVLTLLLRATRRRAARRWPMRARAPSSSRRWCVALVLCAANAAEISILHYDWPRSPPPTSPRFAVRGNATPTCGAGDRTRRRRRAAARAGRCRSRTPAITSPSTVCSTDTASTPVPTSRGTWAWTVWPTTWSRSSCPVTAVGRLVRDAPRSGQYAWATSAGGSPAWISPTTSNP